MNNSCNNVYSLSVIILTFNEEKHIVRCISSVKDIATEIFVIDSFSTDHTVMLAEAAGAVVLRHSWENSYSRQLNWAIDHLPVSGEWVMRLDADEYLTLELASELRERLPRLDGSISGINVRRRIHFLGRWMHHGGTYPMWVLRIWRNGYGRCEDRWMDEHIQLVSGRSTRFQHDLIDENLNDLSWWTGKHNQYANREAADLLLLKYCYGSGGSTFSALDGQANIKRKAKEQIYSRLPLFIRSGFYFIYRFVLLAGFLDGVEGLIWSVLQGFWYRFLVDAKIFEAELYLAKSRNKREDVNRWLTERWGLNPPKEER